MVYSKIANSFFDEFPFRQRKKIHSSSGYFFLSHAHSDHTSGIKSVLSSSDATIVCSRETAAALKVLHRIPKEKCLLIEPNQSLDFDDYIIHAIDANHCLGSLMFVIESTKKGKEVYTGDFRLGKPILEEIELIQGADHLWVDYTYGKDPRYEFPSREDLISEILTLILSEGNYPDKEIWIAAYQIGKEKLLKTISDALKVKINAPNKKADIYKEIGGEWDIFTSNSETGIFVESRKRVETLSGLDTKTEERLIDSLRISPTGWAIELTSRRLDVHYFPYSDHSSFNEVHQFIELANAREITKI
jgi:phosphoribosyl 1,2-cyclic phosphodiesterase